MGSSFFATEADGQTQATQQVPVRSQAGVKGKENSAASAATTGAGDRRFCVEVSATAGRRRGRQVERMGSSFAQVVWKIVLWCAGKNLPTR